MKRKSKAETSSLMAIPGIFAILLVSVVSICVRVPNLLNVTSRARCLSLLLTTMLPETNLALLLVVFLYPVLWGIGLWRQSKYEHGSRRRWVLSCIPDYIAWIILVCGIGYHLLFGENILHSILENAKDGDLLALYGSHGLWLYLWMYGAYIHADTFLLRCPGQRKQIRELFCTEYFLMQPASKNRSFTVTYHFIVDEQDAAGVYYLPLLTAISGWIYSKNKNGKRKTLTFADGRTLEVSEHEAAAAQEILSYASNRLYAQKTAGGNQSSLNNMPGTEETWNPFTNPATTTYQKLVKVFLGLLIILFMMSYQMLK